MLRAVGIGDLHLTGVKGTVLVGGLSEYIPDHDAMVMRQVRRVLKWAVKQDICTVFLYGDIGCFPLLSYSAQLELLRVFRDFPNMHFHTILGNHDKVAEDSSLGHSLLILQEVVENLTVYENPTTVKLEGTTVNFLPWPFTEFKDCLNVCHVSVNGAVGDTGHKEKTKVSTDFVTVAGHLHTNQVVGNTYYSGTLYQVSFGEKPKKSFHLIEGKTVVSIPFVPEYTLHTHTVNSEEDWKTKPNGPKDLVKVVVSPGVKVNTDANFVRFAAQPPQSGVEYAYSLDDFLKKWLKMQQVPKALKVKAWNLRLHNSMEGN